MATAYRIIFETIDLDDSSKTTNQSVLLEENITKPTNCLDFSLDYEKQIHLLQTSIDRIVNERAKLINKGIIACPECNGKMKKIGKATSTFSDVLTDHKISVQRVRCTSCNYEPESSVRTLLNGNTMSGTLARIQSELGAEHSFREAQNIFEKFSTKTRNINNHNRVKLTTEKVGTAVKSVCDDIITSIQIEEATDLILNVDGGHVSSKDPNYRSFEAMTSVVYRPSSLKSNKKNTRNTLEKKSCAASAMDDGGKEILSQTILAALKEGMTPNTHITALCDGAKNCWNVVDGLKPHCKAITSILDWFHIAMKMKNISLPEKIKEKFIRVKWHLWRGKVDNALVRLKQLKAMIESDKELDKIDKFITYITNNREKVVNYKQRQKDNMVFTSNLAESTVESLINKRCKGKQHMQWTREGLDPILQLRAHIYSKDWNMQWKTTILEAL